MSRQVQEMRIRELREAANLTQQQLADSMGVAQSAVVGWENEDYLPRSRQLKLMKRVLGCRHIDDLFVMDDEDPMEQYTA